MFQCETITSMNYRTQVTNIGLFFKGNIIFMNNKISAGKAPHFNLI